MRLSAIRSSLSRCDTLPRPSPTRALILSINVNACLGRLKPSIRFRVHLVKTDRLPGLPQPAPRTSERNRLISVGFADQQPGAIRNRQRSAATATMEWFVVILH